MKAITFSGELEHESVKSLLADIDKIPNDENIVLYFMSDGGSFVSMEIFADYINRSPKRFEMVCYWEMSSAAFELLIRLRCKIILGSACLAKLHLWSNELTYRNLGNSKSVDAFLLNDCDKSNKVWLDELKLVGCTLEEIQDIKKGNDLILDQKRMICIIKSIRKLRRKRND